jgi:hypothetical protein
VPQHKDLKRLVRARMAETSENYTQALTALLSRTRLDPLPDGWFMAGSHPADYDAGLLPQSCAYDGRRVMRLRFRSADPAGGFGTVMQSIDAAQYRGCRVRFSAVIRGREVTDWAGTWLRIDTDRQRAAQTVRRSGPYSLIAEASAFCCRFAGHSLPATSAAVAWPPLTEAATRSRSSRMSVTSSPLGRRVSSCPADGYQVRGGPEQDRTPGRSLAGVLRAGAGAGPAGLVIGLQPKRCG